MTSAGQIDAEMIRATAADAAFGRALVMNALRGLVVEAIVSNALGPHWSWVSHDWAAWDFTRRDGLRLEVKQSAARQSWTASSTKRRSATFDIAARKTRYEGAKHIVAEKPTRWADIYVFAYHTITDDSADHRDPSHWAFYVAAACDLPSQKSINFRRLTQIASSCRYADLGKLIDAISGAIRAGNRASDPSVDGDTVKL